MHRILLIFYDTERTFRIMKLSYRNTESARLLIHEICDIVKPETRTCARKQTAYAISPANIARPLTIQCGARDCGNAHQPSKTFRGSKRNPSYRTALNRIYQAAPPFKAILPANIVFLKTSAGAEHHGISSKLYPAKCICPLAHIRSRRSVRGVWIEGNRTRRIFK